MTTKVVGDILARNAVFQVLSPARRRALAESGSAVQLSKGVRLFGRGDAPDAVPLEDTLDPRLGVRGEIDAGAARPQRGAR